MFLPGVDVPCFLNLNVFSFPGLGKYSAIVSSSKFSVPFLTLSSLSGTPIMLVCLMLSQRFLKLYTHLKIFHSFFLFSSGDLQYFVFQIAHWFHVFFISLILYALFFFLFLAVKLLTMFIDSSEFVEYLYDHYLELFFR